jgi:isoquinoline 1-oxidoreductase alpha subunit
LLARNAAPSDEEIRQGIPNLCRCGVYPRLVRAIQRAARVSARRERISAAPAPGISPKDAAAAVPALRPVGKPAAQDKLRNDGGEETR